MTTPERLQDDHNSNRKSRHHKQYNKALLQVQQQFLNLQLQHVEVQQKRYMSIEREKVLCDQVMHQQFLCGLFLTQGRWDLLQGQNLDALAQQLAEQQPYSLPLQQLQHKEQCPSSYVARLLRAENIHVQVQQVLQMTSADWLQYFANLFPKLVLLLELCHRSDQHSMQLQDAGISTSDHAAAAQDNPAQMARSCSPGSSMPGLSMPTDCADNGAHAHLVQAAAQPMQQVQDTGQQAPSTRVNPSAAAPAPNIVSYWFGTQPPLGQSVCADYRQLQEVVATVATHVMLAYVFNHVPLLQACMFSYSPGPQVRPTAQHWELVADHLHLTELQELHMSLCLDEYRRLNQGSRADGGVLLQKATTPTLLLAAAEQQRLLQAQQQQQQQQQSQAQAHTQIDLQQEPAAAAAASPQQQLVRPSSAGRTGAAAAAGMRRSSRRSPTQAAVASPGVQGQQQQQQQQQGARLQQQGASLKQEQNQYADQQEAPDGAALDELGDRGQDQLRDRLQQYVQRRHVHLLSAATFFINTLSPYQLALIISRSYPWVPSFTAIAEVVAKRRQARQAQQLQSIGKIGGLVSPPGSRSASPPLVAVATNAAAAQIGSGAGGSSGAGAQNGAHTSGAGSDGGGKSDRGTSGGCRRGFLLGSIEQHTHARKAELERHRLLCWQEVNALQQAQIIAAAK